MLSKSAYYHNTASITQYLLVMCVCKKDHNLVKSVKHEKKYILTVVLLSNWICIILCCVQSVVVAIWF